MRLSIKEYELLRSNRDKIVGLLGNGGRMLPSHKLALNKELEEIRKKIKDAHRESYVSK